VTQLRDRFTQGVAEGELSPDENVDDLVGTFAAIMPRRVGPSPRGATTGHLRLASGIPAPVLADLIGTADTTATRWALAARD
jgi:hypothetical protein